MESVPSRNVRARHLQLVALAAVAAVALGTSADLLAADASADRKLSPDLRARRAHAVSGESSRVIVQMERHQVDNGRRRVRDLGGQTGRRLGLVDGFSATLSLDQLEDLASDPRVRRISPDRKVRPFMEVAGPTSGVPQLSPPAGLTGAGITVAIIDSGVHLHEDLAGLAGWVDFVEPRSPRSRDRFGHGTHVAGIIAGQPRSAPDGSGLHFGGMAPGAGLISLRVLDRNGEGYVSDVIDAIQWAVANREAYGIRILNLSLGHPVAEPVETDPLARACEEAWRAGLLVVTSAGNIGEAGHGTITSPGNHPLLLTVGASDHRGSVDPADDGIAPFSSRGPTLLDLYLKPDLVAPGLGIVSLRAPLSSLDRQHPEARVSLGGAAGRSGSRGGDYFELSGSSMAAAGVSAVAALLLEGDPGLSPDTLKARFMASARRMDSESLFDRGAGALDLSTAIAQGGFAQEAVSPVVREVEGEVAIFHAPGLWGSEPPWELTELYGEADAWNLTAISDNGFLDDPCVTGEGLVWQGLKGEGLVWQGLTAEGLVWQGLTAEGLVWQGRTEDDSTGRGVRSEGVCTSGPVLMKQGGLVWQGRGASGEGLVWQGRSRN